MSIFISYLSCINISEKGKQARTRRGAINMRPFSRMFSFMRHQTKLCTFREAQKIFESLEIFTLKRSTRVEMLPIFYQCHIIKISCSIRTFRGEGRPTHSTFHHAHDAGGPPDPRELARGLVRGELHVQPAHRRVLQHGVERALPRHAALPHAPPQTLRR